MGKRRLGVSLAAVAGLFWVSGAAADSPSEEQARATIQTFVLEDLAGSEDIVGPMQKNGGPGSEHGVMTQIKMGADTYLVSAYMSSKVPENERYWQGKCSSFLVTQDGLKAVASDVQMTHFTGGHRNFNRPSLAASDDVGVVVAYGSDYMNPNTTALYANVINPLTCTFMLTDSILLSTTPDNDNAGSGPGVALPRLDENAADKLQRVFFNSYENGGGGYAWFYGVDVSLDLNGDVQLNRAFAREVYNDINIARIQHAQVDKDRLLLCGPYGNTRPPREGVVCAGLDRDGNTLSDLHVIAESDPQQDIYANDPVLMALDFGYIAIKVNWSNGEGRKTNDKGSSKVGLYIYEYTDGNDFVLKDLMEDIEMPFQTHAGGCAGVTGDPATATSKSIAIVAASPTGVGQGMLQTFPWSAETGFGTGEQWIISEYADSGHLSNIYGANPYNQGRNFINCMGGLQNPGYGIDGAFQSTVKEFFVTTMNGKEPGNDKNSQYLTLSPAAYDPGTASTSSSSSGNPEENPNPVGKPGPGESAGGCTYGQSDDSNWGALMLLGLGFAALRRREDD